MHYRLRVTHRWYEVELRPISEVPLEVIRAATPHSLIWDVFAWGMVDSSLLDHAPMSRIKALWEDWQKDCGITITEIRQLANLIDQHSEALEMDLIEKGLRLRDCPSPGFTWHDLRIIVQHAAPNSHIVAATQPERAGWDKEAMLLAQAVDALNWLVWAKTEAAAKGGQPPDPIQRPGIKARPVRPGSKTKPMPISKIREHAGIGPDENR